MAKEFRITGPATIGKHQDLFRCYQSMIRSRADEIVLHLEDVNFYEPFGVCTLAAVLRFLTSRRKRWKVYYRRDKPPANYLKGIGFLEFFGAAKSTSKESRSKLYLSQFRGADVSVVKKLTDVIRVSVKTSESALDPLYNAFGEIMTNVYAHSDSPVGGFVVGQVYPNKELLRVCFADVGMGIRKSLSRNPEYQGIKSDTKAIELALEENVTSRPREHSGQGLPAIADFVKSNEGLMTIISSRALVTVGQRTLLKKLDAGFRGTIINLKISLKRHVIKHQLTFEEMLAKLRKKAMENSQ